MVLGQSARSFQKLIEKTNEYLVEYCSLNPFSEEEFVLLEESKLPKEELLRIREYYEKTNYEPQDSISNMDLIFTYQELIMQKLSEIIGHKRFGKEYIENLLDQNCDLQIVVSQDRKFYNFSIDEKTGGTYRSRVSLTYFTEDQIKPVFTDFDEPSILNQYGISDDDGLSRIDVLKTDSGTKYVLSSYVRGCSYCFETRVMLVSWKEGGFQTEFDYSVNSRDWNNGVNYDSASQSIIVDYITDDLTPTCDCSPSDELFNEDDSGYESDYESLYGIKCHSTYRFNGHNFDLTKQSWERIEN